MEMFRLLGKVRCLMLKDTPSVSGEGSEGEVEKGKEGSSRNIAERETVLFWSRFLLLEMITRVSKNIIRKKMRTKMTATPSQQVFNQVVVDHLNTLLGSGRAKFWNSKLKKKLMAKFEESLTREEMLSSYSIKAALLGGQSGGM